MTESVAFDHSAVFLCWFSITVLNENQPIETRTFIHYLILNSKFYFVAETDEYVKFLNHLFYLLTNVSFYKILML